MKILVAITGASGSLYAQRLLDNLDPRQHEIHVVFSNYAGQVIREELPQGLRVPEGEFVAQISDVPPQTRVTDDGKVVPIKKSDVIGQAGSEGQKQELGN